MKYIFNLPQISSQLSRIYAISIEIFTFDDNNSFIRAEEYIDDELKEFIPNKKLNLLHLLQTAKKINTDDMLNKKSIKWNGSPKIYYSENKQDALILQLNNSIHIRELLEREKVRISKILNTLPVEDDKSIKLKFPQYFI